MPTVKKKNLNLLLSQPPSSSKDKSLHKFSRQYGLKFVRKLSKDTAT